VSFSLNDDASATNSAGNEQGTERVVGPAWALWTVAAAFGTYFCMYAFRKPFTAATFEGLEFAGVGLKTVLVTAQVIGYSISKFIGIKVISELPPARRATVLISLVVFSEIALVLFGFCPAPWNILFMFLNGLPLGMVFGLVMGFLGGRRVTEILSAGLCASFILADGATKSVGAWLLNCGISQFWMPAAAGGIFLIPLIVCVGVLSKTPPPSRRDVEARSERIQMNSHDRWSLARRYSYGLAAIVLMYLLVTILRSIRADFAAEIWQGLGVAATPGQFTTSEMIVAFGVVLINGSLVFVNDNRRAFLISLCTCLLGFLMLGASLIARSFGLSGFNFMVLVGLGLYLPYVAVHATIFERLLAMTRGRGNVGFLMYVADATGYLGYVGCMLLKGTLNQSGEFLPFFTVACWITCIVSIVCMLFSWTYFNSQRLSDSGIVPN